MEILKFILNKKITGLYQDYLNQSLKLFLDNNTIIIFHDCALAFDLGIIGHTISYVSDASTLGMTFELKNNNKDPDQYKHIILSRDINDVKNKNELLISYKSFKVENP